VGPHHLRAIVYILGKPCKQRGETRARAVFNKMSNLTRPLTVKLCILWASTKFIYQQRCAVCVDSSAKEQALVVSLHRVVGVGGCCGWEKSEAQTNCPADGKSVLWCAKWYFGFCRWKARIQSLNLICVYSTVCR